MNVLLAIPTAGNPTEPFLAALRDLRMPASTSAFDRVTIVGNFIPGQRELAARRATSMNADVLIMFDDDMIVPPDAIIELTRRSLQIRSWRSSALFTTRATVSIQWWPITGTRTTRRLPQYRDSIAR